MSSQYIGLMSLSKAGLLSKAVSTQWSRVYRRFISVLILIVFIFFPQEKKEEEDEKEEEKKEEVELEEDDLMLEEDFETGEDGDGEMTGDEVEEGGEGQEGDGEVEEESTKMKIFRRIAAMASKVKEIIGNLITTAGKVVVTILLGLTGKCPHSN